MHYGQIQFKKAHVGSMGSTVAKLRVVLQILSGNGDLCSGQEQVIQVTALQSRLLDHYKLGGVLGEGSFGVVWSCDHIITGEEHAVKMVDKVETPFTDIMREAELIRTLDHPNIVKCFGIFFDNCFVCIVMDKFVGGDVVQALQEGQLMRAKSVRVGKRPEPSHAKDRLSRYPVNLKTCNDEVDVWALGVLTFGLVTTKFPFKGEGEVRNKQILFPPYVHDECAEMISMMLKKEEGQRASAADILRHPWLDGTRKTTTMLLQTSFLSENSGLDGESFQEAEVDHEVTRRRLSLIDRMQQEHLTMDPAANPTASRRLMNHTKNQFFIQTQDATLYYKWIPSNLLRKQNSLHRFLDGRTETDQSGECLSLSPPDVQLLDKFLREHNIETAKFGVDRAKSLQALAAEVHSGASRLMLDAANYKKLVRVVDVVVLKLYDEQDRLLVDMEEHFSDGRRRPTRRLPGSKKETTENIRQTAERILEETLNLDPALVSFNLHLVINQEEELDSPSYPGLHTVYRKEIVTGTVESEDPELQKKFGLGVHATGWRASERGCTRLLQWMTEAEAVAAYVKVDVESSVSSSLVQAPIGLKEEELTAYLTELKVDVSQYGRQGAKTLKQLSDELVKGEVQVGTDKNGVPVVVSEVVNLCIHDPMRGEMLCQYKQLGSGDCAYEHLSLPCTTRRPEENEFLVAKRILKRRLRINPNTVILETKVRRLQEERSTNAYPGLIFVERELVITANLDPQVPHSRMRSSKTSAIKFVER
ncbi:IPL1 [Symbiodinium sp. CCMP2456]|nr:IPL1 [Symbiodinium sp. CCMP2456]